MKCSFCGHELEPGSNFCPECGTMMSVDDDSSVDTVTDEQKYEPDSAEAYSKQVSEDGIHETEPEEELSVPEYVPHAQGAFEDYNTIRRNEEEAEAALEAAAEEDEAVAQEQEEIDDPFAELHPDYEPASSAHQKTEEPEEEVSSDDDSDMYVKSSKSKKGGLTIAVLTVVLIAVIVVGVNAVRSNGGDILSVFKRTTSGDTTASTENSSNTTENSSNTTESTSASTTENKSSTTKKDEKSTTDKTTKESTTDKEKTTTESTTNPASESTSAKPSDSQNTTESTTRAYTTTTTRAYTTTTRPQTTYMPPTTTSAPKPTGESLQKPSKYYSSPVTRYASSDGISMRLRPSSSSTVRASISIGGEVKVYGEENGYYYVYYARYGVYGWVNGSYLSKERPVAENEVKVSGVVKPDKTYSNVVTKTVTTSDGLRLRKGPGTNYDTIRYLGKGYPVAVKGTSSKNPGWVYVTDITRGVSGWVSSAYIK